ncbi:MAG: TRAP transporter substrate-binding protein DctP [Gammaproteobacteria bacterium]|nr:TRAP transporter substrate-binding protein DctP [Gammaproteobacteria bacterium]MDH4254436.1 TRAP transporter substrate-binding protein DctP [Gammaproteobacteria bacterium]MDH5309391.1 TRAP transporter substrate-binding protein DctP [Gammaproteobacteria bacterium]
MRPILTFITTLALALGGEASLAQTQIKIATLAPQNSSWAEQFRAASDTIGDRTQGRVKLKFYWGGAQGNEQKVLQKIKIGQLHGGTFSPTDFQEQYPDLNIYGLPFLFENFAEVEYVRQQMDRRLVDGFDDRGFQTFGFASGGFAYVLSNQPVRGHGDLIGKKVWLPQGDLISYEAMKSLQLSPVPLPITDVLTGLQTGLIDIVAIPPVVALALQWHTKVKYLTQVPVLFVVGFMAIDERVINKLDPADRAVVAEVLRDVYVDVNAASAAESENATQALLSVGIEDVKPAEGEFERIRSSLVATNRQMAEKGMFSAAMYDEIRQHIEDFRSGLAADSAASTGGSN